MFLRHFLHKLAILVPLSEQSEYFFLKPDNLG